jgi:hypothetical protein
LEYAIVNNNGVYIRLNNGQPVACTKKTRDTFQKQKAENILEHLPKSMRRLHFKLECIPDIKIQTPVERIVEATKTSIKGNDGYEVSESVRSWIDKFGECERILNDAAKRYKELEIELKRADEELIDILHEVELEKPVDLYRGWIFYKRIRTNRKNRRNLKDEMVIIHNVIAEVDTTKVSKERTQKAINGLFSRKYRYRIVEVENGE